MLTVNDVKTAIGLYNIPKYVHINKGIVLDYRLFRALVNPDYENNKDYKYDFDIYLPKYGINLQRDYVWEPFQQNEFILSILQEKPIEPVVVVAHIKYEDDPLERRNTTYLVIDGKQRLMTIQKFGKNEFPITIDGHEYYFNDFDDDLKRFFSSRVDSLTAIVYYSYDNAPVTDDMKITLFNFYNFAGTHQTAEHKERLQALLHGQTAV